MKAIPLNNVNHTKLFHQMYIFELTYPGIKLDLEDKEAAFQIENWISNLESALSDAAMSLNFFEAARQNSKQYFPDTDEWEKEAERRQEIMALIREKLNIDRFDTDKDDEVRFLSEIELRREKWGEGQLPRDYHNRIIFIHAKSFLLTMDRIEKFLNVLAELENVPREVSDIKDEFEKSFPDLRQVRNSSAHMEDRIRKLGPLGKKIDPKPISNSMVNAPKGGVMVFESLIGNNFGSTMADGHYGEVVVSYNSVEVAKNHVQSVINSFEWKGPKSHYPR